MKYNFLRPHDIDFTGISFWQSDFWSNILLASGQAKEVFFYGNSSSSWALVEIRSLWLWQYGAFSLGIKEKQVWDDFSDLLSSLKKVLAEKWALFLQIEPIGEIPDLRWQIPDSRFYKAFLTPHTRVLDLTLPEEDILKQMHEKGRYNIRLAEKRGVIVESAESTKENLDIWMKILSETTSRDGFSGNPRQYYEAFLSELQKGNMGGLYFARLENRVIAAAIFVFTPSQAIYYYGASSSLKEDKKHMAPYLLQWHAILEAKKRQIPLYDFLWVADPDDPSDPLRGVTEFKEKFGGTRVNLPQKILFPLSWKYKSFLLLRKIAARSR